MNSLNLNSQISALQSAGTGQLRQIAKLWKIKYVSKLKREDLIFSIIGKQQENEEELLRREGKQLFLKQQ